MEREGFILLKESSAGISLAVVMIMGLILFILTSSTANEENPQQTLAEKLKKKEEQLEQKEEKLKQIEQQLKAVR
jgi:ABC-type transporter MlaC component